MDFLPTSDSEQSSASFVQRKAKRKHMKNEKIMEHSAAPDLKSSGGAKLLPPSVFISNTSEFVRNEMHGSSVGPVDPGDRVCDGYVGMAAADEILKIRDKLQKYHVLQVNYK